MKIAVPDLVSNSYFPALAAVELGFFKAEGLDMTLEHITPVDKAYQAMRDGAVDFVAGSAHGVTGTFPEWRSAKLLAALAQGMYWLLVLKADLGAKPGDVAAIKGLRIGAAPVVELGLRGLLAVAGIDPVRDKVEIMRVPGHGPGVSFGITAAKALKEGLIDGFWANAMGAAVAVRSGAGTVVLDVRRGLGPRDAFYFSMPALVATDALIARAPDAAAAAVRAIMRTQKALKADPALATKAGEKVFPPQNAEMIAELIRRDLPYYDAAISPDYIARMNHFAISLGLLQEDAPYERVVAAQFAPLWS